jgi:hypothetical protein
MERKKIVHTLDTPFSTVKWSAGLRTPGWNVRAHSLLTHTFRPQIPQEDQDAILELLCQ